jgi:hypothetical protein
MNARPARGWLAISPAAAPVRREVGPLAWVILEELAALADPATHSVAANTRDLATRQGVGEDTAARAFGNLRRARLVVAVSDRGAGGRFRSGRYELHVGGLMVLGVDVGVDGLDPRPTVAPDTALPGPATPDPVDPALGDSHVDVARLSTVKAVPNGSRRARHRAAAAPVGVQLDLLAVAAETGAGLAASMRATPRQEQP